MKEFILIFFLAAACIVSSGQAQEKNYNAYSGKKTFTEMEWRLIRINQRLAHDGIFVEYDKKKLCFMSTKLEHKENILEKRSPEDIRKAFLADCAHTEAVLGSEFPEFAQKGNSDLIMIFRLDDEADGELAVYRDGSLTLKDGYYQFVRKNRMQVH